MTTFSPSFLEIEPRELVRHLLRDAGQAQRNYVNPADLLSYLKLEYLSFDFSRELPPEAKQSICGGVPRALLSFDDRIVATDNSLDDNRTRFSMLHEIGHYVLPQHEHALYVCDDIGMGFATRLVMEREANEFAADLLFLGNRFSAEANSRPIAARTVKELAMTYRASFEATARRFVEKSFRPCMVVVFKKDDTLNSAIRPEAVPRWSVRYCVASPTFKSAYCQKITGEVPEEAVAAVTRPGSDIADGYVCDVSIPDCGTDQPATFRAEFFCNTWNIFGLLTPAK